MENIHYKPRIVDDVVQKYLKVAGAVCIEGTKWCGKTWTSAYHCASSIYIGSPENHFQNRKLAEMSPDLVLQGEIPRLIDEWQEVPLLWDAIRYEVDQRDTKGQFILTGSSTPNRKGVLHSGAGRIVTLRMRPMSLYESQDSTGDISLKDILSGKITPVYTGEVSLLHLFELIIRGGWPGNLNTTFPDSAILPNSYIRAIIDDDMNRLDGIRRDSRKMELLLHSLARNESTTVTNRTLKRDIQDVDGENINPDTITSYLDVFKRLFLTDNQPPFSTNIRSSVRIKQAEKRHLSDPSLSAALLGATPNKLVNDLETAGFLFEALCERDLRIYAESLGASLYHYQDYANKEIDAVIEDAEGNWYAFEIKLGANQIDEAAANLLSIRKSLLSSGGKIPKEMCVICGLSNAAYRREDGVFVVPITSLKP